MCLPAVQIGKSASPAEDTLNLKLALPFKSFLQQSQPHDATVIAFDAFLVANVSSYSISDVLRLHGHLARYIVDQAKGAEFQENHPPALVGNSRMALLLSQTPQSSIAIRLQRSCKTSLSMTKQDLDGPRPNLEMGRLPQTPR